MLCAQHHLCHVRLPPPYRTTSTTSIRLTFTNPASSNRPFTCLSMSATHNSPEKQTSNAPSTSPDTQRQNSRRHNFKSTSFLHHHLSPPLASGHKLQLNDSVLSDEEKARILELSLVQKHAPQFPGSIYVRPPHSMKPCFPPLKTLLSENDGVDEEMLLKAVEIRRKVTVEIFADFVRRKGKFGINYVMNLAKTIPEFVDVIIIEASLMKKLPEFEQSSFNFRARTFIDESGVVPLIRWFKHNSLSYPQIGRIICLSKGNIDYIRRIAEWLKSIHVKGRFIGVVLTKVGETILNRDLGELEEIVEYLESKGLRSDWMGYVIGRCPELLAFSMDEVRTRVSFYMDMGMNEHDFGTMVYDCPKVLGFFSLEEMRHKASYIKEFGLSDEDLGRLLAFKPQLMVVSIEDKLKPLIKYLYYLGIGRDGLRRILVIKPMVYCVDLETTIAPKVRFLQDLGVKDDAIGRMLVKFPPLLTYSLYKKIRPVVIFLLTKAGVRQENIAQVIASAPELLGCSIAHKLDGNVKYFLSLGISLKQLGEMIADFPMLLRYNTELLRPKYCYLRRVMVRCLEDVIEYPRFFSYSLDERIIPRHKVLVNNRINFKLRYMLPGTDEDFNKRVQAAVERRNKFESGVICSEESEDNNSMELDRSDSESHNTRSSFNGERPSSFSDEEDSHALAHSF